MLTGPAESNSPHGFGRAAVVGAGLMGRRIAGVLASGGLEVTLTDARPEILDAAAADATEVAAHLAGQRRRGPVTAAPSLAQAMAGASLVIEAVLEDLSLKQDLFADLERLAPGAVLATNTSVLPVTAIASKVQDGSRVVGAHWWNPPDLIPIVEVVPGERTDAGVADRMMALLTSIGKVPVRLQRDVPGFVGNRLQHALWREAIAIVASGIADAQTVDLVVRNTIGLRLAQMGPIENADYVGLDLTLAIHDAVLPGLDASGHPSPLLRQLVDAGQLGAKSGHGFLDWPPGAREQAARGLALHVARQLEQHSSDQERKE